MSKRRKSKAIRLCLFVLVLFGLAYAGLGIFAAYQVRAAVEREGLKKGRYTIQSGSFAVWPWPTRLFISGLQLDPIDSGASEPLVCVERMKVSAGLIELLRGDVVLSVELEKPVLRIECDEAGDWNFKGLRKEKAGAASQPRQKRKREKATLRDARLELHDGQIEFVDRRLEKASLVWRNINGTVTYRDGELKVVELTGALLRGKTRFSGTSILFSPDKLVAHIVLKVDSLKSDPELKPFLARYMPRTAIEGNLSFDTDVDVGFAIGKKNKMKLESFSGGGSWRGKLGIMAGPEIPDYVRQLLPELETSRLSFFKMNGEFNSRRGRTRSEMELEGKKFALFAKGATESDGRMKYVVSLEAGKMLAKSLGFKIDKEVGKLRLFTFYARIDSRGKLSDERFDFEAPEVLRNFMFSNGAQWPDLFEAKTRAHQKNSASRTSQIDQFE